MVIYYSRDCNTPVIWVLYIIAFWKVFTKAGQPGWKAIIPVYNEYILYKISWKPNMFWIYLILSVVAGIFCNMDPVMSATMQGTTATGAMGVWGILGCILTIAAFVICIMQNAKTSKAYGHGAGYTLGLIFLNWIFMLILGFGKSEYKGPQA